MMSHTFCKNDIKSIMTILVVGLLFAGFIIELHFIISSTIMDLVKWRSMDDAFYYLNTAWNFAKGNGLTFDQINQTNGVQPLWFLIQSFVALFANTKESLFRSVLILQTVITFLTPLLILRFLPRYFNVFACLMLSVWVFCIQYFCVFTTGLEPALNLLAIVICTLLLLSYLRTYSNRTIVYLSIACGILFLTRVDNAILVCGIIVGLAHLAIKEERISIKTTISALLPISIIVLSLLITYEIVWGHIMPVSGSARSVTEQSIVGQLSGMAIIWHFLYTIKSHTFVFLKVFLVRKELILLPLFIAILLIRYLSRYRDRGRKPFTVKSTPQSIMLFWIGSFVFLHFVVDKLMFSYKVHMWHNIGEGFFLGFLIFAVIGQLLTDKIKPNRLALTLSLVFLCTFGLSIRANTVDYELDGYMESVGLNPALYEYRYKISQSVGELVNETDILASWNAGQLGFFSDRRIVNLDGVINSYEYLEKLKSRSIIPYLKEKKVDYILDYDIELHWNRYSDESLSYDVVHEFNEELNGSDIIIKLVCLRL